MKKIIITVLALLLVACGCLKTSDEKEAKEEVIKIGIITPLTTDMSNWGESMKGGIEIALDEKSIKGKTVELIFEDNKACDSKETVSALRK